MSSFARRLSLGASLEVLSAFGPTRSAALAGPATFQKSLSMMDMRGASVLVARGTGKFLTDAGTSTNNPPDGFFFSGIGLFSPPAITDGALQEYFCDTSSHIAVRRNATNKFEVVASNGTNGDRLQSSADLKIDSADAVFAWRLNTQTTGSKVRTLWKDGAQDAGATTAIIGSDIGHNNDWTNSNWSFGGTTSGNSRNAGMIALIIGYNTDVDWEANKNNWWDATNGLKDPGPDGSNYTGTVPLFYFRLFQGEDVSEFFKNRAVPAGTGDFTHLNEGATSQLVAPYWPKLQGLPTAKWKLLVGDGDSFMNSSLADTNGHGFRNLVAQATGRLSFNGGVGGQQVRDISNDHLFTIEGREAAWLAGQAVNTPGDVNRSNQGPLERRVGGFAEFGSPKFIDALAILQGSYNDTHGSPFILSKFNQGDFQAGALLVAQSQARRVAKWQALAPNPRSKNQWIVVGSTNGGQAPSDATAGNNVYLANDEEYGDPAHLNTVHALNGPQYNAMIAMLLKNDEFFGARHYSPYAACMNFGNVNGPNDTTVDPIDQLPIGWVQMAIAAFGSAYTNYVATGNTGGTSFAALDAYDIAHGVIPSSLRAVAAVGGISVTHNGVAALYNIHLNKYGHFCYAISMLRLLRSLGFCTFTGII